LPHKALRVLLADSVACSDAFATALRDHCPNIEIFRWPDLPGDGLYDVLVTWRLPQAFPPLAEELAFIFCFGAGADELLKDPRIPEHLPITRLVDPFQAEQMLDYAAQVAFSRLLDEAGRAADQENAYWRGQAAPRRQRHNLNVTVLGLGPIGRHVATGLARFGFSVKAWSRTQHACKGVTTLSGSENLALAAAEADVLINLLPLVPETENILSATLFAQLSPDAYVANLGRGRHLDEDALIAALDEGRIGASWLDAFRQEPLPANHRFWRHPKIRISSHVAALPTIEGSSQALADSIKAYRDGRALPHPVGGICTSD
jgi:glyoxylate/hydroxypyruvate reductase